MSSKKRIEANRRNAQKSTGPRTPEGKARSAQNATTHGLSSLNYNPLSPGCFLHIEDETKFLGLLNQYVADYRPQRQDEIDLLTEAVYTKWKQQRLWLAETAHLEVTIAQNERDFRKTLPNANAPAHLANAIGKSGNGWGIGVKGIGVRESGSTGNRGQGNRGQSRYDPIFSQQ